MLGHVHVWIDLIAFNLAEHFGHEFAAMIILLSRILDTLAIGKYVLMVHTELFVYEVNTSKLVLNDNDFSIEVLKTLNIFTVGCIRKSLQLLPVIVLRFRGGIDITIHLLRVLNNVVLSSKYLLLLLLRVLLRVGYCVLRCSVFQAGVHVVESLCLVVVRLLLGHGGGH